MFIVDLFESLVLTLLKLVLFPFKLAWAFIKATALCFFWVVKTAFIFCAIACPILLVLALLVIGFYKSAIFVGIISAIYYVVLYKIWNWFTCRNTAKANSCRTENTSR